MCKDCGCGLPGETPAGISGPRDEAASSHPHEHEHQHSHGQEPGDHSHEHDHPHGPGHHHNHDHDHPHTHPHSHTHVHSHPHEPGAEAQARRMVEVREAILGKNDRLAERNRGFFQARGWLVLNVLSSPGSGKTTFLRETVLGLGARLKAGIIVGDLATDNDARRLRESGAPVVQVTTGTVCHLEAEMVAHAVERLGAQEMELLIIENVGNLVCPASYDLGEDLRVVLISVTEGEDKPLKYPPMFQAADVVVVSKSDLAQACGFDRDLLLANLKRTAPKANVFETSARTGQGMEAWLEFLVQRQKLKSRSSGTKGTC